MSQMHQPAPKAPFMKRYGALLAIVVVAVIVIAVVVVSKSTTKSSSSSATTTTAASSAFHPAGVLSFSTAKAEGKLGSVDWGARCDTSRGKYAFPYESAGECYAPFSGDNGGSTAQGVSSSEIKVVLYLSQSNDPILNYIESAIKDNATQAQTIDTMQHWVELYNHYYEMYGRKVVLVPFVATGASNDPVSARADAVTIATNIKPFAVWGGPPLTTAFADELSARHVMCLNCGSATTQSYYSARAPYVWSLGMLPDQGITHLVNFLHNQVVGHPASFAGTSSLKTTTRKFGLITLSDTPTANATLQANLSTFKARGVPIAQSVTYASPLDLQTSAPSLIAKLKSAGVTSVIFDGDPIAPQALTRAATAQNWYPEWIISGSVLSDTAAFGRTYDQAQWSHAFGVSFGTARVATSGLLNLYKWYFGSPPPDLTGAVVSYAPLALFYPTLQGVGPDLTAQNFQNALFAAKKPPKTLITMAMYTFGSKGIWPGTDFAGVDDGTEVWWNAKVSGPDELGRPGTGLYEYVNGGRRYLPSQWPTTPTKAFQAQGAITIYPTAPAGEQPPSYPSPAGS